jgi:hypothetical protein
MHVRHTLYQTGLLLVLGTVSEGFCGMVNQTCRISSSWIAKEVRTRLSWARRCRFLLAAHSLAKASKQAKHTLLVRFHA